jgi:hypothetical protein
VDKANYGLECADVPAILRLAFGRASEKYKTKVQYPFETANATKCDKQKPEMTPNER